MTPDSSFALTVFWPERLARRPQVGIQVSETWAGFVRWVSNPVAAAAKDAEGGFTVATLRDGVRNRDHVESVTALAVDHDDGATPARKAHEALSSFAHVVFTTHSHTPERPRWRAIVPFDRPVAAADYPAIYATAVAQFAADGIALDRATKDPCRLWYTPTVKPGGAFEVYVGDGKPASVDAMIAVARELERRKPPRPPSAVVAPENRDRYARGALERAARSVSSATPGERHGTLFNQAHSLSRDDDPKLAPLTLAEIEAALYPAWCAVTGPDRAKEGRDVIAAAFLAMRGRA